MKEKTQEIEKKDMIDRLLEIKEREKLIEKRLLEFEKRRKRIEE